MSNSEWTVTKTVNISEFKTSILLLELYNRLDDYMNDPEPQYDSFIEEMTPCERLQLKEELRKLIG